ncbi:MAG: ATP-binding protein [Candidatus Thiothrix singaporensis]|uniref:ATP-binding protein n=1 Tax=Candidatus Thiothrix singaporensis TaxID=2799669 RepID=A0A7L6AX22_9GAMM|nr:MAG: ATP-binding protein [Candidatus Thiothrix singaporensis]
MQPREGEVIGRASEVADVLHFLNSSASSAAVCGHVTGSGGIGKTEVGKAANMSCAPCMKPVMKTRRSCKPS